MKKINQFLINSFNKKIDATGLAIFRIAYSIVLLCEIAQFFYFRHLMFDSIPYIKMSDINFAIPIGIWFISVLFILFGAFTRFFTILNYLMSLILIGSIGFFEYHVFYAYMGINFLIMFIPISRTMSIDRLIEKIKYSSTTYLHNPSIKTRQFYYFLLPFVGLAIVYTDSVFYKVVTPMWYNGLGSWLPSSLPMITHANTSWFNNQEFLVKFIGWFTILFETLFIFIFFRKKLRWLVVLFGLMLHFGILLEFPIPWFGLTACCLYILIIPVSFWTRIFTRDKKNEKLTVYYDTECPLCVRTKITVNHIDSFNKVIFKTVQFDAKDNASLVNVDKDELLRNIYSVDKKGKVYKALDTYIQITNCIWYLKPVSIILRIPGIYHLANSVYNYVAVNRTLERCTDENCGYNPPIIKDVDEVKLLKNLTFYDLKLKVWTFLLVFVCFTQMISITHSWSFEKLYEATKLQNTKVHNVYMYTSYQYLKITRTLLGLTPHQVFTDRVHFDNYNHIISVVYQDKKGNEQWLPIIDKNGQPDLYIYGANWVNWTFRVNGLHVDQTKLLNGVKIYSAFWAKKNNVDLRDAKFLIKVKKIDSPNGWEKDFLNKQIAKPWVDGGYVLWEDNKITSFIKDIESI